MPIYARFNHALGAHTPTSHSTTISRFLCNFSPDWPLNLVVSMIHQVIWPSPSIPSLSLPRRVSEGYPGLGEGPGPGQITWRIVMTKKMRGHLHRNRELAGEWAVGVWVHRDSWLEAKNWRKSWNQIQTLKNCLYYCIYCAQLGSPWGKIARALFVCLSICLFVCHAVSNSESRYWFVKKKIERPKKLYKNREIVVNWEVGVWAPRAWWERA